MIPLKMNKDVRQRNISRCREKGIPAYHIQVAADLHADWFAGIETVGLTAGTSTLDSSIAEVHEALLHF